MMPFTSQISLSTTELAKRRDSVCTWFTTNRISVVKYGDTISVADGALTIEPPYCEANCNSSNEIILSRIRNLLSSLPTSE